MSEPPLDPPLAPADRINDALIEFTGCVGESLADVCSYGLTIGEDYVPFDPDPEDECGDNEVACTQAWVRVVSVTPINVTDGFSGTDGCAATFSIDLEVGVLRCLELPEDGEAPTASDVLVAAAQAMADMNAIYCAAMACEVWDANASGAWAPSGPLGGHYGGTWSFSVEI
jgi:hypothetical protein